MAGVDRASGTRNEAGQLTPTLVQAGDTTRQPTSIRSAAELVGASTGNIQDMKRIAKVAPEKVEEIRAGVKTVNDCWNPSN